MQSQGIHDQVLKALTSGILRGLRAPLDLVFARQCEVCGRAVGRDERYLCWDCRAALPYIQFPYCSICGDPVSGDVRTAYTCSWCRRRRPHFDAARSALRYLDNVRNCLWAYKYRHALYLADDLAEMLTRCVDVHYRRMSIDAVTYVPLHFQRLRDRTFNQSAVLAAGVARRLGLECSDAGLRRTRRTATQTDLNAAQRRENVKGAFAVRNQAWTDGRGLLLVDDVMSTGATVDEVARVLKQAGAVHVWVATVGRG